MDSDEPTMFRANHAFDFFVKKMSPSMPSLKQTNKVNKMGGKTPCGYFV